MPWPRWRATTFNRTLDQHAGEARMSVECSMLAISAERYDALRSNPRAVTDEVILRSALDHLAGMAFFKKNMSEAEVLAEIRATRHLDMVDDPRMRRQMAERYARQDAL